MALPKEIIALSTFSGGMAPDIGQVVRELPNTAEDILNAEVQKDGGIRRRPAWQGLVGFTRVGRFAEITGDVYVPYGGLTSAIYKSILSTGIRKYYLLLTGGRSTVVFPVTDASTLITTMSATPAYEFFYSADYPTSLRHLHHRTRILIDGSHVVVWNKFLDPHFYTYNPTADTWTDHGKQTIKIRDTAGAIAELNTIDYGDVNAYNKHKFTAACLYNQRLWMAGYGPRPNTVFISQVISPTLDAIGDTVYVAKAGKMYAESLANIVATDGGTIEIRDAKKILALTPFRKGVAVIADNGIWYISGPDGVFSALSHNIERISNKGAAGEDAWCIAEDNLIYASMDGINFLGISESGEFGSASMTEGRISGRVDAISAFHKRTAGMHFDETKRQIYWAVNDDDNFNTEFTTPNDELVEEAKFNMFEQFQHCRSMYVYDLDLKAWVGRWTLSGGIAGFMPFHTSVGSQEVVFSSGAPVTVGGVNVTAAEAEILQQKDYTIFLIQTQGSAVGGALSRFNYAFALSEYDLRQDSIVFSGGSLGSELTIVPKVVSHPFTFNNLAHEKRIHWLHTAFRRVEKGIEHPLDEGTDINPGSCQAYVAWDGFVPGGSSHPKAGTAVELYHPHRWTFSNADGSLAQRTIQEKHKIRGRGTTLQIMLTNENGEDFYLNGWQVEVMATGRR